MGVSGPIRGVTDFPAPAGRATSVTGKDDPMIQSDDALEPEFHHAPNAGELRKLLHHILTAQDTTNRHLHRIEKQMTDLQQSVTDLQAAVQAAVDALGTPVQALKDQLAKAQDDLAALQVQDDADKAALTASLQASSDAADSIEAQVSKLNDATTAQPPAPAV